MAVGLAPERNGGELVLCPGSAEPSCSPVDGQWQDKSTAGVFQMFTGAAPLLLTCNSSSIHGQLVDGSTVKRCLSSQAGFRFLPFWRSEAPSRLDCGEGGRAERVGIGTIGQRTAGRAREPACTEDRYRGKL